MLLFQVVIINVIMYLHVKLFIPHYKLFFLNIIGRNITGVKISRQSGKRAIFIEGGQVGADWLSPTIATYIVDQLVRGAELEILEAAEEFEWHIFPIVNPDGHEYTNNAVSNRSNEFESMKRE